MHMKMNKDHHPYAESVLGLAEGDSTQIHTIIQHRIWIFLADNQSGIITQNTMALISVTLLLNYMHSWSGGWNVALLRLITSIIFMRSSSAGFVVVSPIGTHFARPGRFPDGSRYSQDALKTALNFPRHPQKCFQEAPRRRKTTLGLQRCNTPPGRLQTLMSGDV